MSLVQDVISLVYLKTDQQTTVNRAVFVAQLVERSLPLPEVRGSNPVIGKIYLYIEHFFTVNCVLKKMKIKKKRPGLAHFF